MESEPCPTCGDEFESVKGMRIHHSHIHNESIQLNDVVCDGCGEDFKVSDWRLEQSKDSIYCSKECRKTGEYVDCEWCDETLYKHKEWLNKSERHFCSPVCVNEWQSRNKIEFECRICGDTFKWSPSRVDNHDPTYCSIECRDQDDEWVENTMRALHESQRNKNTRTDIEQIGKELLDEIGVGYTEQYIIGDKFRVDVFIEEHNLIIQWDGDYWHCHPKYDNPDERQRRRKRIDKSQNAYFDACGYDLLRFWGSEIHNNISEVENEILHKIN